MSVTDRAYTDPADQCPSLTHTPRWPWITTDQCCSLTEAALTIVLELASVEHWQTLHWPKFIRGTYLTLTIAWQLTDVCDCVTDKPYADQSIPADQCPSLTQTPRWPWVTSWPVLLVDRPHARGGSQADLASGGQGQEWTVSTGGKTASQRTRVAPSAGRGQWRWDMSCQFWGCWGGCCMGWKGQERSGEGRGLAVEAHFRPCLLVPIFQTHSWYIAPVKGCCLSQRICVPKLPLYVSCCQQPLCNLQKVWVLRLSSPGRVPLQFDRFWFCFCWCRKYCEWS